MDPMRVAYVVPPGGTLGPLIGDEITGLKQRGPCEAFVYSSDGRTEPALPSDSSDVLSEGTRPGFLERVSLYPRAMRWRAFRDLRIGTNLAEWVLSDHASVIHTHAGWGSAMSPMFAKHLSGIPLTVTVHSAGSLAPTVVDAMSDADRVFAASRYTASWLKERGIDARVNYPSPYDGDNVGKGLERTGKAIAVLIPRLPGESLAVVDALHRLDPSVVLWIAGTVPRSFKAVIKRTHLSRRVTYFDELLPVERPLVFRSCDILCMPELPYDQDLPYDVVLAVAAGKPVVAPGVRGIPELVKGVLDEEPDGRDLAEAIGRYASDPEKRVREGKRNLEVAAERLGPGNVDKLRATFRELSGGWANG